MKRPLFLPVIFFLVGILLAGIVRTSCLSYPITLTVAALTLVAVLLICSFKNEKLFIFFLCLFFMFLGIFRYMSAVTPGKTDISRFATETAEKAVVYGTVSGDPRMEGRSYLRHFVFPLKVERVRIKTEEFMVTGKVLVSLYSPGRNPRIGDDLVVGGKLFIPKGARNPHGFDYKTYMGRGGVHAVMVSANKDHYFKAGMDEGKIVSFRRFLFRERRRAAIIIRKYLSGIPAAVVESVTLGKRSGLTDEVNDVFMKTGTMHILAVSGLHIGIIGLVIMGVLRFIRIPKKIVYFLTILGICSFAAFSGGRPSSVRAAIMGSFVLFGLAMEWKMDILNTLVLSAFLITFFQPGQIFQAGFILSYLAVLSIIYLTPLTDKTLGISISSAGEKMRSSPGRMLLKFLSVSLAVWAGMIPVVASYFHIITPAVVLSNLLAVPALTSMIVLGFGLIFAGSFSGLMPAAYFFSETLKFVIPALMKGLHAISYLPFAYLRVPTPGVVITVIYYTVLAGTVIFFRRVRKYRNVILIFLLFAANLFVWERVLHSPRREALNITFFDTGKSDAALLEFVDGSVMLIDGGSGGLKTGKDAGRYVIEPYLRQKGINRIDYVLLTHSHEDHIGGLLHILKNFRVGTVIDGESVLKGGFKEQLYKEFRKEIKEKKIRYLRVERGDILRGFDGVDLFILNPPGERYGDTNRDSIVTRIVTTNGNSILFCADIDSGAMKDIMRFGSFLKSDIIKVPHHGGKIGKMYIVRKFISQVHSKTAVITNSRRRKVTLELLKAFEEQGTTVYITAESGAVIAEETANEFKITEFARRTNPS